MTSPLRRSRTAPWRSGTTQPKQMPIRQPEGIRTPAASPASSSGVAPSDSTVDAACVVKRDGAAVAGGDDGGPEPLGVQPVGHADAGPVRLEVVEQPGRAARPGLALGEVGDELGQVGDAEHAVGVGVPLDERIRPVRPRARAARRRRSRRRRWARECTTTTSARARADALLRSMPITGVMPLPAVTNRTLAGRVGGQDELAAAPGRVGRRCPAVARRTRWLLTLPSGIALTVIGDAAVGAGRRGRSASRRATAARRRRRRRCGRTGRGRGRASRGPGWMTRVTASRVSGWTCDDPAAQVGAGAQRVDDVEVVGRDQRGGPAARRAEAAARSQEAG